MDDERDLTIPRSTPDVHHNSKSHHPSERAEGDAFEFTDFPQSHPLRNASPGATHPPSDDVKDTHVGQTTGFGPFLNSDSSKPRTRFGALLDWKWETICCLLAVAGVLAIMATLYPYDGHPLPQWPYGLSINTLISIYITIMKAAMSMILAQGLGQLKWTWFEKSHPLDHLESFDGASRGALGAVKLLWVLRGRNLATAIGALVMIFALAIDPFAQELIRYYTCNQVVKGSQATISKTNFYDNMDGIHAGAGIDTIPLHMQSAIYAGIFSPGTNRVAANCPTGNCTFSEQYKTIAYCASCSDITSLLNITTYNVTSKASRTNYTLPSGLQVTSIGPSFVVGWNAENSSVEAILGIDKDSLTCYDEWPWTCTGIGAAKCRLSTCVRTFSGNVQAGALTETETQAEQDTSLYSNDTIWGFDIENSEYISTIDLTCVNSTEKNTLKTAGYKFNDETQWLAYNASLPAGLSVVAANASNHDLPANFTILAINGSCIYQTSTTAVTSMSQFFTTTLNGSAYLAPDAVGSANSLVSMIFNNGNVSANTFTSNFLNLTDSMSTDMRTHMDSYTPNYVAGVVLQTETCVNVRWGWLAFPAVLVLLTLVFFVVMIFQTRTREAMVNGSQSYKASALPLMFHGLEDSTTAKFGTEQHGMDDISHDASHLRVVLRPTDFGWKFVESS